MIRELSYPQVVLLGLLGCLLVGLVWGLSTSSVTFGPYNNDWDGASDLRTGLDTDDTSVRVALSADAYGETEPQQTAAVVLEPGDRYSGSERAQLSSFVARGGTLVVAATTNDSNELLAAVGSTVRLDGTPVRDEQNNYRDPALVQADNVVDEPPVADVDALTLNHGTVLHADDATRLVNTSATAYLDANRNQQLDANETLASLTVATVETLGAGRLVVVSDASAFTNAMFEREGNEQFVRNLADNHDNVVLDYSQYDSIPPLTYAFLQLQESALLQFLVGLLGVGTIAVWGRGNAVKYLSARVGGGTGEPVADSQPDEDILASHLRETHPGWEDEQIRRVTKAIIRQRQQEGYDD